MNRSIALMLVILGFYNFYCQNISPEYYFIVSRADSLYKYMDYKGSALTYHKAFATAGGKGLPDDRYKASCAWALVNLADSAFTNLEKLALKPCYLKNKNIELDINLKTLHNDKRWAELTSLVHRNSVKCNYKLSLFIDSLAIEDQIKRNDYRNYPILRKIIIEYGYPDYDVVGELTSSNFWLLIQHQDLYPDFQDSVLILLKNAYNNGKASGRNYAYLVDRVKCNKGELQVYGTQMNWKGNSCEPKPVIEPEYLDERRKSMGLSSEEDYIKYMMRRYIKKNESHYIKVSD